MDFITGLPQSANRTGGDYNSILIIVDQLTKMVYYKLMHKIIITPILEKVVFNIIVWDYGLFNFLVSKCGLVFTSKFWFFLYYFLNIK